MTREELERKLAQNPRFKLVRERGSGFVILAGSAGKHLLQPNAPASRQDDDASVE